MGYVYHRITDPVVLAVWWIGNATLLFCVVAYLRGRRREARPMAGGRTVAIVTAHEHDADDLHACIWSVLNQRGVVIDEVHVVDAGSVRRPVRPFAHPRVRWHRTTDSSRSAAQVYVLDRLQPDEWDFVLIVDGAGVLDERSLEHQLRAFSRPRVAAAAGRVVVRDRRPSLLARIADLDIGAASALLTVDRSPAGTLRVLPGAPVLHRFRILMKNRRRHLAAGDFGDDRRLLLYAAAEGEVVGVSEAIAWTRAPADLRTAWRQRLRWSTSWWRLVPLAFTVATRPAARLLVLAQLVVGPLAVVCAVATARWPLYAALYLLTRYASTGFYLIGRPEMSDDRKFWTWLLLTPVEALVHLLLVVPVRYLGLLRLRRQARERDVVPLALPGTVYYGGYLPDGGRP
jgi:cellulose synthase/poly-beta-1,6-N-acetylglucosamine synthase-like glycosyltransferase